MTQPKVSVIILHLNDVDGLLECLTSLGRISYANFDIFVVHNGPENAELEKRLSPFSGRLSEIIHNGKNLGFAGGNNIGIKRALRKGAEYVFLLNDDTVVGEDFLDILIEAAQKNPLSAMMGPEVRYFDKRERISFSGAVFDPLGYQFTFPRSGELAKSSAVPVLTESDYITGCALLVKKAVIEKIGLLDERFFLYWEDTDWCLRAKKAGFLNFVAPAAKIWDKVSASSGGNDSPLNAYHKTRGQLLFAGSHVPGIRIKLIAGFARDIAWLLFKSSEPERKKKALAYLAAMVDYFLGKTGSGPLWLWPGK